MFYYLDGENFITSNVELSGYEPISEERYLELLEENRKKQEVEERAAKEAEVARLLRELYPDEYKEG